jgi:choline-phosphate cytidylyltransferase
MDLKRHVQELRENITNNWTSTGQELSRELRQFWPASRPQSPARFNNSSSTAVNNLDVARSPTGTTASGVGSKEFLSGYAVGLAGGFRSWVRPELSPWRSMIRLLT